MALGYADTIYRLYPAKADGSAGTPGVAGYNRISGAMDTSPRVVSQVRRLVLASQRPQLYGVYHQNW